MKSQDAVKDAFVFAVGYLVVLIAFGLGVFGLFMTGIGFVAPQWWLTPLGLGTIFLAAFGGYYAFDKFLD